MQTVPEPGPDIDSNTHSRPGPVLVWLVSFPRQDVQTSVQDPEFNSLNQLMVTLSAVRTDIEAQRIQFAHI